jgi:hypothetical protein
LTYANARHGKTYLWAHGDGFEGAAHGVIIDIESNFGIAHIVDRKILGVGRDMTTADTQHGSARIACPEKTRAVPFEIPISAALQRDVCRDHDGSRQRMQSTRKPDEAARRG